MPSPVALLATISFIWFLFVREAKEKRQVTRAIWLPFWWTVIACSRSFSEWLNLLGIPIVGGSLEEGSPIDRIFYLGMIVAGLYVLRKRCLNLGELIAKNRWLFAFLLFCLLAVVWSDYPFVSLKRWIKVLGHPIMALIVLSEPDPEEALTTLMRRCGYVLIPVSILFIKYYPQWGRGFSPWTGEGYNTGITTNKNLLGVNCLILGFVYTWYFLKTLGLPKSAQRRNDLALCALFLGMNGWLLSVANSKTPLVSLFVGISILILAGFSWVNRRYFGVYLFVIGFMLVSAEWLFGIYEVGLQLLGRSATLTDRTILWEDLLNFDVNPLLGAGFESFWLGERMEALWERHPWGPNQAHNGYLETYLNIGLAGLFMLVGLLIVIYRKASRELATNFNWARFRIGFLAAASVYNWTEAGFKTTHPVFFILYVLAIDFPRRAVDPAPVMDEDGEPRVEQDSAAAKSVF